MKRRCLLVAFLLALLSPLSFPACSDDPVNEPYDDDAIRVLVYRAMYERLPLDTLGCGAMAVAQGDSLEGGLFWPKITAPHSQALMTELARVVPLRIVGMELVSPVVEPSGRSVYRTTDKDELAVACFTRTVERIDGTHLVVQCGMQQSYYFRAFAGCDVAFESRTWRIQALNLYYSNRRWW